MGAGRRPLCPFCGRNDLLHYSSNSNSWRCGWCEKSFPAPSGGTPQNGESVGRRVPRLYQCPRCGQGSLLRNPEVGLYECLNRDCQAIFPYRTAKHGRSKRRRRRRFTAAALIVAVLLLSFVAVLVCAFADVAPFSTARDWMAGQSAGSGIPPGEDRPYWEYFDRQPPYSKSEFGGRIQLVNNEHATDPTWDELRDFLLADPTDLKPYTATYLCGSFAEEVHNNAKAAGIRAAWVSVDFVGETVGHALNAFRTVDRGLVYVDCTGGQPQTTVGSYDTVAYIELGKEYGRISLSAVEDFSYESYEKYVEDWNSYDAAVDAFSSDVDAYNSLYDKCGGYYDTYAGCSRLESWYKELETLRAELDAQSARLGEWRWEPLGVVEKVEIWW